MTLRERLALMLFTRWTGKSEEEWSKISALETEGFLRDADALLVQLAETDPPSDADLWNKYRSSTT